MPAGPHLQDDDASSSDDGFEVKAVTTADGVRVSKQPLPSSRPASLHALGVYRHASSSSSSSSSSPAPSSAKKRVRFADPVSPRKRLRIRSPGREQRTGERADEEAVLMSELARFEARVDAVDRDQDTVTQDLLDASDFYEQAAQLRWERRVAALRSRVRENKDVQAVQAVHERELENMHAEQGSDEHLSEDDFEIKRVLRRG